MKFISREFAKIKAIWSNKNEGLELFWRNKNLKILQSLIYFLNQNKQSRNI